jgi:hypothetical protein
VEKHIDRPHWHCHVVYVLVVRLVPDSEEQSRTAEVHSLEDTIVQEHCGHSTVAIDRLIDLDIDDYMDLAVVEPRRIVDMVFHHMKDEQPVSLTLRLRFHNLAAL